MVAAIEGEGQADEVAELGLVLFRFAIRALFEGALQAEVAEGFTDGRQAVSYTHLDVYKRQVRPS